MSDADYDAGRDPYRPYAQDAPPMLDFMQRANAGHSAIHRSVRADRMLQPGNTPWHVIRPGTIAVPESPH